ncbi:MULTISPECIES: hypothetical protein [Pseudomonas]|uniref:DUF2489 domain-containing protein n=1 Tax=Pseudomonas cedrina TaxID=651740 RepID=A0A2S9CQ67_PSECE|nr:MULTISPECIES: hypothetical protein [Pseudomonas]AVJ25399.1 hypothetical protein CLM72_28240 [Pseudomonas sp. MYb193]PRB82646.1 hypothetical protein CQ006_28130 [Pseudomonas cedrina]
MLETFLTSAVVAALVGGYVSLVNSERKIQIENVTQERAKWREQIRLNAIKVHKAAIDPDIEVRKSSLTELRMVVELLLNPHDPEDVAILRCIEELADCKEPAKRLPELSRRLAFLLKHDWERAKREAKPWWCRHSVKKPLRESLG